MSICRETSTGDNSYTVERGGRYTCSVRIYSVTSDNSKEVIIYGYHAGIIINGKIQ